MEMVAAVIAGDGLERVAQIASQHAGAPVAVIVPRLGAPAPGSGRLERYVTARLAGGRPRRPPELAGETPIASGDRELGAVLLLGQGRPDAGEYMHMAAVAALTEVAVAEAREDTEQTLRGSFIESVLTTDTPDGDELERRARRLGCDLGSGYVAICVDVGDRAPGRAIAAIGAEREDAIAQNVEGRVFALLPGDRRAAERVAVRLGRQATVGLSSQYSHAADARRALDEAELVLGVKERVGEVSEDGVGGRTYRLLFRVLASHPEEVRSFYDDTVAPLVRYDQQYSTDLVGTLDAYLEHDCNMNATAKAIHAHRHTVAYRLERVKELSGLDPVTSEDRERLGLGMKAYRIIAPTLPR